jgi:hypothetical protein
MLRRFRLGLLQLMNESRRDLQQKLANGANLTLGRERVRTVRGAAPIRQASGMPPTNRGGVYH